MDDLAGLLVRLFCDVPYVYLSWPALAMVAGTLLAAIAPRAAQSLSVVPRTAAGLVGLATAPFIHFGFAHLAANLPPFLVLGFLVLQRGPRHFLTASLLIAAMQGGLLWLLGRRAAHAGMSGILFGYFGFIVAAGWLAHAALDLAVACGVLLLYGGMLAGIAPARNGTSWEGHLFGIAAGGVSAWILIRA